MTSFVTQMYYITQKKNATLKELTFLDQCFWVYNWSCAVIVHWSMLVATIFWLISLSWWGRNFSIFFSKIIIDQITVSPSWVTVLALQMSLYILRENEPFCFPMLHCSLDYKKCTKWLHLISSFQPCVCVFWYVFFDNITICAFVPVSTYDLNMTAGGKKSYTTLYVPGVS